ncbi:hypothetical protein B0H16DRAFT_1481649 [Mycena metata]|uniref:Uncharacterized protein n=1 Tax=Mycena metata TaxID=1033252 RepID=A0AAD7GXC0_9AGAR|nr:hypothetical protein B0H16DRAFT_1481649 [Mycena metata]
MKLNLGRAGRQRLARQKKKRRTALENADEGEQHRNRERRSHRFARGGAGVTCGGPIEGRKGGERWGGKRPPRGRYRGRQPKRAKGRCRKCGERWVRKRPALDVPQATAAKASEGGVGDITPQGAAGYISGTRRGEAGGAKEARCRTHKAKDTVEGSSKGYSGGVRGGAQEGLRVPVRRAGRRGALALKGTGPQGARYGGYKQAGGIEPGKWKAASEGMRAFGTTESVAVEVERAKLGSNKRKEPSGGREPQGSPRNGDPLYGLYLGAVLAPLAAANPQSHVELTNGATFLSVYLQRSLAT